MTVFEAPGLAQTRTAMVLRHQEPALIARWAVVLLPFVVTLSLAKTPAFLAVFPFMLPTVMLASRIRARVDGIAISFALLAVCAAISAVANGAALTYAFLWGTLPLLYLTARSELRREKSVQSFTATFLVVIVVVALIAVFQVVRATTAGTPYVVASNDLKLGLTAAHGHLRQRPVGVFQNSNILGQWLVFSALTLVPILGRYRLRVKVLALAALLVPLALTYSRAVWAVAVSAAIIFGARWLARRPIRLGAASIALALASAVFVFLGGPRFSILLPDRFTLQDSAASFSVRQGLNDYGWKIIGEHPLLGVGYNKFVENGDVSLRPHNVFVQVAAEQGLFASGALFVVLVVVALGCWGAAGRVKRQPFLRGALLVLPVAWAAFLQVYSSAADFAIMPAVTVAVGFLLSRVDALTSNGSAKTVN